MGRRCYFASIGQKKSVKKREKSDNHEAKRVNVDVLHGREGIGVFF
jgi:hypothetical protein